MNTREMIQALVKTGLTQRAVAKHAGVSESIVCREAIAQSLDKQADLAADDIDRQWAMEMAAAVRARSNK